MEIHETCLDVEIKPRKTDGEVKAEIEAMLHGKPVTTLQLMEKQKRDEILRWSKVIEGATQRQIARVTGLNQNIVLHSGHLSGQSEYSETTLRLSVACLYTERAKC